jgi:dihydroorotase
MKKILFVSIAILSAISIHAQSYTMLIKGGHVIDPKNGIDAIMDVAVQNNRIALVAPNIDPKLATQVISAVGMYVTPGLIDMHGHVFAGTTADGDLSNGFTSVPADAFTFRSGITTIVDAGSSGAKSFPEFIQNVINKSQTRVLAFLNISYEGMRADENSIYQQNPSFMDPEMAANVAKHFKNYIVGIKVAHFHSSDFIAVDRAIQAGKLANLPVMVDFGGTTPMLSIEDLLINRMRPGDIFTHAFGQNLGVKETIVDLATNKLKPFVVAAQKKGVIFDVGHGGGSFAFTQAIPAAKAGFFPNTISTDLHTGSMNSAMKDILNVMSKFLAINMDLQSVVKASTWSPAQAIRHEELGHLSVGAVADIAVLSLRQGKFGFYDVGKYKVEGSQKLECELTVKGGRVVYDLNAISMPLPPTR